MKFKTTQKEIRANFNKIICVPYCGLQTLLSYESPVAYTVRREGWGADIYDMGGGVAIVTGYAPFGNIRPSYKLREWYETQAEKIRYDYSLSYNQQREDLKILARDFIRGVVVMNKREYCESRESIAYYSGLGGLEIKGIEYGVNDFVYCVSGCWGGDWCNGKNAKRFHRCKIYYPANGKDSAFFRVHGYKIPFDECIRMGV